jgi:transaldolase
MYVQELVGADSVTTLPEQTLEAFADHGRAAATLTDRVDDAVSVFQELAARGIDVAAITAACERDGLHRFGQSHNDGVEHVRRHARRLSRPRCRRRPAPRRWLESPLNVSQARG